MNHTWMANNNNNNVILPVETVISQNLIIYFTLLHAAYILTSNLNLLRSQYPSNAVNKKIVGSFEDRFIIFPNCFFLIR